MICPPPAGTSSVRVLRVQDLFRVKPLFRVNPYHVLPDVLDGLSAFGGQFIRLSGATLISGAILHSPGTLIDQRI